MPIINKPKHLKKKKGEYKEQNGEDPCPRNQKNHLRRQPTRKNIKFLNPLVLLREAYQISKRGGGCPERKVI